MRKEIALFFLIFISFNLFGQKPDVLKDIERDIIKENKVAHCIEYLEGDSLHGYYNRFDSDGLLVEKNFYNKYQDSIWSEVQVHFIYNKKQEEIAWLWYEDMAVNKITRIRIEELDSTGNSIGYMDFGPNTYKRPLDFTTYGIQNDTCYTEITNKEHQTIETIYYSTKDNLEDRLSYTIRYLSQERLDSIEYYNLEEDLKPLSKIVNHHLKENIEQRKYFRADKDSKMILEKILWFNEKGLPIRATYFPFYGEENESFTTRFEYVFWSEK